MELDCNHCCLKGDLDKCEEEDCSVHESWYTMALRDKIFVLGQDIAMINQKNSD